MTASKVSFNDIINSINNENSTISAGNIISNNQRRNVKLIGEINDPVELNNIVVKTDKGPVYLNEISDISFKEKDKTSYARSFGEKTILLDVVKRGGKNLIIASNEIKKIIDNSEKLNLPNNLKITITNDQSNITLNQVSDLVNNIIFGVILVVSVLMFFLGFRNSLFVGFAIPMSMFMSFT